MIAVQQSLGRGCVSEDRSNGIPDFLSRLLNLGTGDSDRLEDFLGDLLLLL